MSSDWEPNQRRSLRLKGHDYTQAGFYFVTLCAHQRQCLFGTIRNGSLQESSAGVMIRSMWEATPTHFPRVELDDFVIMPNHLHGLLHWKARGEDGRTDGRGRRGDEGRRGEGRTQGSPLLQLTSQGYIHPIGTEDGSLGRIVQAFKSLTTHQYTVGVKQSGWPAFDGKVWQRDYHDRIVREEAALNNIRRYIADNPLRWEQDEENPHSINGLR